MQYDKLMVHFRKALPKDAPAIRKLIYQSRLNPMNLDWRHFMVAVDDTDSIIGIGQIKRHKDGSRELASIAVQPGYRGLGIGSAIIQHLLAQNAPPLFLTCRASLELFYQRFGFRTAAEVEMTPYFKRIYRVYALIRKFIPLKEGLLVMVKAA